MLFAMKNVTFTAAERAATGECLASILTTGLSSSSLAERAAEILDTVLTCLGSVAKGAAAVLVAIIGTLSSLLLTQLSGMVGELTGSNHVTIRVGPTPKSKSSGVPLGTHLLGDLDLASYCAAMDAGTSNETRAQTGPGAALDNWVCTGATRPRFVVATPITNDAIHQKWTSYP